jgi:hypothetical protein
MSIKLVILKTGETIISDIREMVLGEEENRTVIGYYLHNPCAMSLESLDETIEVDEKTKMSIRLFDWMPLAKDRKIPIVADWVVGIVDPLDSLKETYGESYKFEESDENG